MLKTITCVIVIGTALILLWYVCDQEGRVSRAVGNTIENASLAAEERSLPPQDDTSQNAVIRKAMLEQRERDNREWTAANRAAHPDLYLEHCEKKLLNFLNQYEDAIIEVKTTINLYRREIATAEESSTPLIGFLKEAKRVFSDESHSYPVKVGVYTYKDSEHLKTAVIATDEKLSEFEQLITQRNEQLEHLQTTLSALILGRDKVKKELNDLGRIKAQTKTDMLQQAVNGLHARMNELLSGVDTIVNESVQNLGPGIVQETPEKSVDDIFSRRGID